MSSTDTICLSTHLICTTIYCDTTDDTSEVLDLFLAELWKSSSQKTVVVSLVFPKHKTSSIKYLIREKDDFH